MTATLTITDFLLARIAEDEYVAGRAGSFTPWSDTFQQDNYGHLTVQPARVLADCSAYRAIVEAHPIVTGPRILAVDNSGTDFGCETCHCIDKLHEDGIVEALGYCDTLRALASVYAGHADYRTEWAS